MAGMILIALMVTNPSIEDHRQEVLENYDEYAGMVNSNGPTNEWADAAQQIGLALGKTILEKMVTRDNYYIFSISKLSFQDESRMIGVGFLGKVFLKDYASMKTAMDGDKKMADNKIYEKWTGRYVSNVDEVYLNGIFGVCIIPGDTIRIQYINDRLTFSMKYVQDPETTFDLVYYLSEQDPLDENFAIFEVRDYNKNMIVDLSKIKVTRRGDKYYFKVLSEVDCPDDYVYLKK
jgi:hypothetical protein